MNKKYNALIGTRVHTQLNERFDYEYCGCNDCGVPYFHRVKKGKVQKKEHTLYGYDFQWLETQLAKSLNEGR